jgi:hypothetical protein
MQKTIFTAAVLLSLILFSFPGAYCSENEEAILSYYQDELERLNAETDEAVSKIGPIEFSSFSDLNDIENVVSLKQNLRIYWETKKHYFDKLDDLLKTYRKKLGQEPEQYKRLEGTAYRLMEKLEKEYVANLDKFYDLVLRNHDKMSFEEGRFYLDDERLVIRLNTLWAKAVESTRALVAAVN